MKNKLILAGLLVMFISNLYSQQKPVTYLFVGSYTAGKPDTGIYVYTFNVIPLYGIKAGFDSLEV